MSDTEILEKAWDKAQNNGYQGRTREPDGITIYPQFIFNHDFAKALWGIQRYARAREGVYDGKWIIDEAEAKESITKSWLQVIPLWQFHLQQMVIADDPIKYLGEYL